MTKVSCGHIRLGKVGNLTLELLRDFSVLAAPQPLGSLPLLCWPQTPLRRTSGNQWSSEHSVGSLLGAMPPVLGVVPTQNALLLGMLSQPLSSLSGWNQA